MTTEPATNIQTKELTRAWILTIILHLLIAAAVISYWHFSQNKQPNTASAYAQTQPVQALQPLLTTTASVSTVASTAMTAVASTVTASTTNATTNKNQTIQPNIDESNVQNNQNSSEKTLVEQRITVTPAAVNKALTTRDIPPNEINQPTVDAQTRLEIEQITQELDENYEQQSKIIEQVKRHNQKKIEAQIAQNASSFENQANPTTENDDLQPMDTP